ncbi:MAG TPA: DUF1566 domain-containing protein, partial [Epsilonproteobacteria bacterium]|nr:DUF1566 domain-containing protein [Campylobacterota bacterium]
GSKEFVWYKNELLSGDEPQKLPKTGQLTSYADFDDGWYTKGTTSNFSKDSIAEIVTDSSTSLMWQDNTDTSDVAKKRNWADAQNYCHGLLLGGYDDWRLPQIQELYFIAKKDSATPLGTPFEYAATDDYWSADISNDIATYVNFADAYENYVFIHEIPIIQPEKPLKNVRCVRGETDII